MAKESKHFRSPQDKAESVTRFWQTGEFSSFLGKEGVDIAFAQFIHQQPLACIVISPGRCEGYLKYQELSFELFQLGYNIFIIDHRGQGLSGRMAKNRQKGFVTDFDDYAQDLNTFIEAHVSKFCPSDSKPYLLAHSMGGAIAIRTIQLFPALVEKVLLSSPMVAIETGYIPLWLARIIATSGVTLNQWLAKEPWYFFGQQDYKPKLFGENELMHSRERYAWFINLYEKHSELKLGGVTFNWLAQALEANSRIFNQIANIEQPITLLQAGADTIVNNGAQLEFIEQLNKHGKKAILYTINDARHELLFELDLYRNQALNFIEKWLSDK